MNTATVRRVADIRRNMMPMERGFDAYIAEVVQPIVDAADDKATIIAWLNTQLDTWGNEAKRPSMLAGCPLEGGVVLPFAAEVATG